MGVSVVMDPVAAPVVPGQRATGTVRVRNTGAVVDQFELDVTGEVGHWAHVEPASINLLPGEEHQAQVVFTPPRSPHLAEGSLPYAVRVMSREDTAGSAVQEATIEVAAFSQVGAELQPRTSTGRRGGRHEVAVDNLGNHPELVALAVSDPDLKLTFHLEPANVTLEPGTTTFVKLRCKPRRTFWKGPSQTVPFQVSVTPDEGETVILAGALLQRSLLPSWVFKAALLVAVGAVAFAVLWFTLFKPTIESTAKAVAEDNTEKLAKAITDASAKADQASTDAAAAADDAASADGKSDETQDSVSDLQQNQATPATTFDKGQATDFRVTTDVAPGAGPEDAIHQIAAKQTVWISDLVLQNPAGDTGTLRIRRGDDVLLVFGLENFRDLDYHFIQPAAFDNEAPVVVAVDCKNEEGRCTPSVYFSGQSIKDTPKGAKNAQGAADTATAQQ